MTGPALIPLNVQYNQPCPIRTPLLLMKGDLIMGTIIIYRREGRRVMEMRWCDLYHPPILHPQISFPSSPIGSP